MRRSVCSRVVQIVLCSMEVSSCSRPGKTKVYLLWCDSANSNFFEWWLCELHVLRVPWLPRLRINVSVLDLRWEDRKSSSPNRIASKRLNSNQAITVTSDLHRLQNVSKFPICLAIWQRTVYTTQSTTKNADSLSLHDTFRIDSGANPRKTGRNFGLGGANTP